MVSYPSDEQNGVAAGSFTNRDGSMTSRDGSLSHRMTPRTPRAGAVSEPKLTPRRPLEIIGEANRSKFPQPSRPPSLQPVASVSIAQLQRVDAQSIAYLSRKLVNLSTLLNQDTISDDRHYPSFVPAVR